MDLFTRSTTDECNNNRQPEEKPPRPMTRARLKKLKQQTTTKSSSRAGPTSTVNNPVKDQEPMKRGRLKKPKQQTTTKSSSRAGPSSTVNNPLQDFKAKYTVGAELGAGDFGRVYASHREEDNLPVAIKRIKDYEMSGDLPLEVALLQHLKPADGETSAVVSLLDWYLVDEELILVLERPDPCMDLDKYMKWKKNMQEDEVKILAKQLLDCLIDVHSKGVFHQDIKLENILIETGSPVPRYRLIDFGCGAFVKEKFTDYAGTKPRERYTPEPITVWQFGLLLFKTLHGHLPFHYESLICNKELTFRDYLSSDCKDFLRRCLTTTPEERATMETLLHHPWLTTEPWKARLRPRTPASPRTKEKKKKR